MKSHHAPRRCHLRRRRPPFSPPRMPLHSRMSPAHQLALRQRFLELPEAFYQRVAPTPVPAPYLVSVNPAAVALLDLDPELGNDPALAAWAAGNELPAGVQPLATGYAGHQFGVFVPQLGDGRAILLGDLTTSRGARWEVQLKGAGQTRYSRFGDGRAVLRSTIREYLCGEAMAGLGIPTTRALAIVGSDLPVLREETETAAVLVRLAPTHVRFGHFEYVAARGLVEEVRQLADWVIAGFFPGLPAGRERYPLWLEEITARTARLVAAWMAVGWAHGVMNTDNMSILGLTLDYGPFGFQDAFDAGYICNHSDHEGRYAWDQQPAVALWNLTRLAESLLSLMTEAEALQALNTFQPVFQQEYDRLMRAKLGLRETRDDDRLLTWDLLQILQQERADYPRFFRRLGRFDSRPGADHRGLLEEGGMGGDHADWTDRYATRLRAEQSEDGERAVRMARVNPAYVLRNYLAEQAIRQAREARDYGEVNRLLALLQDPFTEQPGMEAYLNPPPAWARELTVSCSS